MFSVGRERVHWEKMGQKLYSHSHPQESVRKVFENTEFFLW